MTFDLLINGQAVEAEEHFPVYNPATEEVVAQCPKANLAHVEQAVSAAKTAFKSWRLTSREERNQLILKMADAVDAHREELAKLITLEQGKPLQSAFDTEVDVVRMWCEAIVSFDLPVTVLEETDTHRSELHYRPMGVVAGITPWNFPVNTAVWKILPAVATGNTVIIKPSPYTPLATLRLGEIIRDIFPPGVVNILAGADEIGRALSEHPEIKKISLTGSVATGKKVMASAAMSNLKRVTLELGGNDPAIVMDDVDIDAIVPLLFWYSFVNAGQVCIAIKRLYVHEKIYDKLCEALVAYAKTITVGDGMDPASMIGPIQNKMQYEKVVDFCQSVIEDGGEFLCGGVPERDKGYFAPISIVTGLKDSARLVQEEQFGPVLPVLKFSDIDDVIDRANDTNTGLGASVWCQDKERAQLIATQIESGTVWINHHMFKKPTCPFGGLKESGIGVENSALGLAEFTYKQVIGVMK